MQNALLRETGNKVQAMEAMFLKWGFKAERKMHHHKAKARGSTQFAGMYLQLRKEWQLASEYSQKGNKCKKLCRNKKRGNESHAICAKKCEGSWINAAC
jgi:hypothetical protein